MSLDVYLSVVKPTEVYNANITHNLGKMAGEAGIYEHLWHPKVMMTPTIATLAQTNLQPHNSKSHGRGLTNNLEIT